MSDPVLGAVAARLRAAGCVFAEDEAALLLGQGWTAEQVEAAVCRREAGEPLEQILGWACFDGLRVRLLRGVFVPRQRSASMVAQAVCRLPPDQPAVAVDVGCGSGALGAAVSARRPQAEVWGLDIDPTAVECARLNLNPDRVVCADLLAGLPARLRGTVDVILANLPYVPTAAIALLPAEAREHEHRVALDGGVDGLDHHRRLLADVGCWLRPGGHLLIECGADQVEPVAALIQSAGLTCHVAVAEEVDGHVIIGRR